jgi:hypothetical protein
LGFDIEDIAVEAPSSFRPHWSARLGQSKILRDGLRRLPLPISAGLRAAYAEMRKRQPHYGRLRNIVVTEESALLHRCQTKLPSHKAEQQMGYRPVVSFEDACKRSIEWMKFAGYPVVDS